MIEPFPMMKRMRTRKKKLMTAMTVTKATTATTIVTAKEQKTSAKRVTTRIGTAGKEMTTISNKIEPLFTLHRCKREGFRRQ
jgi:uncharacterized protein YpuA (DUF1002 family)